MYNVIICIHMYTNIYIYTHAGRQCQYHIHVHVKCCHIHAISCYVYIGLYRGPQKDKTVSRM
jgi:hypothetical protein